MKIDIFPHAPAEWPRQVLAGVAVVNPRYRAPKSQMFPFVEMAAVAEEFGGIQSFEERALEGSGLARFKANDILFGKITPCAENGKVALVPELPDGAELGIGSTEFIVLSPREGNNPRWVYALLCADEVHGRAVCRMEGSTGRQRVTESTFTKYLWVPVPPKPEQDAIAGILNAADAAIARAQEAVEKAQRLKRGLMQKLLPRWIGFKRLDADAVPHGYTIKLAAEVARVVNGTTPSRTEAPYWRKGTVPWLATGKVNERIIRAANECVTEKALAECSIEVLPRGSVLVAMIGQGKTRGKAAYLDLDACINQNFGAFVPGPELNGKYLFHYFELHYWPLREIGGGTNQGALNCFMLKRLRLPIPSLEAQGHIVKQLGACDQLIEEHHKYLQHLQKLKRGLMQDLLSGRVRVPLPSETPIP